MNKEFSLSYQDSNLDKQSQNLLCYRYTIAQCGHNIRKLFPVVQGVKPNYFAFVGNEGGV